MEDARGDSGFGGGGGTFGDALGGMHDSMFDAVGEQLDPGNERAAAFARALARYGLSPMDLMGWANSVPGLPGYKDMINSTLESLSGTDLLGEFGRGFLGRSTLRDLTGYYSPTEKGVMSAIGRGMQTFGGIPGMALAGALRGGAAIGTGQSERDFGGGFGKGDMTAGGLGDGTTVASALGGQQLGQTIASLQSQIQALMQDYRMSDVLQEHSNLAAEVEAMRARLSGAG